MELIRVLRVVIFLVALSISSFTHAQLCQGSLGDPVVNLTFGAGSNFGQQLGSSTTSYIFANTGCPGDGYYVISNSVGNCFSNSWHQLIEDHTPGDTSGYMMVVNASFNPGEFYARKVDGLCGGTTYQLAAWIINVQKSNTCGGNPIKPKARFKVETTSGTVLLDYSTGDIASDINATWKQYGAFFTVPAGTTSVSIKMINDAPGGCGNDLALDDITFRPCGASITTNVNGGSSTYNYCVGETPLITFSANVTGGVNTFLQWQSSLDKGISWNDIAGATSINYTAPPPTAAGTYLYRLSAAQDISSTACRVASNPSTINVYANPVPVLSSNSPVCEGGNLALTATNGAQYRWTGPLNYSDNNNTTTINNVDTSNSGKYYVTVTSDKGCTSKDSITAVVYRKPVINLTDPPAFCEGGSVVLNATGTNLIAWNWTPSAKLSSDNISNPKASPDSTTTYFVTATNGTCSSTASVNVTVINRPFANAGPDKISFTGNSVRLNGSAGGSDVKLAWSPVTYLDQPTVKTPLSAAPADMVYTLTVANICGVSTDEVLVKVYAKTIPNAFSPNGDGVNDKWNIPFLEIYPDAVLNVFNRHGQPVYSTLGSYKPWDGTRNGKPLPGGTYYYTVSGSSNLKFTGWVLIVR